jgi:hypothetical protein
MRFVVVTLVATVALTGCGKTIDDGVSPPPRPPSSTAPGPGGVQEIEDIVNGLDGVVGSAEADTAND